MDLAVRLRRVARFHAEACRHRGGGTVAAVGPVKAKFKGRLRLADLDPPNAYTIQFDGQGGAAGHGKGSAQVRLEDGGGQTRMLYNVDARVGGKLAQYDTPAAILGRPASEFVADFVGADRGLKRLSLARVRELDLIEPVLIRAGEDRADVRRRLPALGHRKL